MNVKLFLFKLNMLKKLIENDNENRLTFESNLKFQAC